MKIALIGPGGFLGSSLLKGLAGNTDIEAWHLLSSSVDISFPNSRNCYTHFYKWPLNSLSDDSYKNIFLDADVILYAAGAGIQPGKDDNKEIIYNLNLFEPARLVHNLVKFGFKGQFISFGSYFEIGVHQPAKLIDEQAFIELCNPVPNAYCHAKKELTHFHVLHQHMGNDFKWLHLVLTNIFGPGEYEKRLIPYIISQSKHGKPLHFTAGSQIRQYTYVGDIVKVVLVLLGKASGMYHVTKEETVTIREIIEETLHQVRNKFSLQPEIHYDLLKRRDTSMDYLALSSRKLFDEWGLSCPTNFKEGVSFYFIQ